MVEVFSAAHRTGKYIPGEEPLLSTSICRFYGVDLLLDYHSPETAHSAHAAVVRRAAEEAFEKHLLPLDVPCTYHSQGPTKKQNPKLCRWARSKTRQEQAGHVFSHTLTHYKQHHVVGNIPYVVTKAVCLFFTNYEYILLWKLRGFLVTTKRHVTSNHTIPHLDVNYPNSTPNIHRISKIVETE
jgi:hypothetical protein